MKIGISAFALVNLGAALLLGGCASKTDPGIKISTFGYDPEDATRFIQQALDSGAPKLILDKQAGPWYTLPLKMRSNTELILEPGVELVAKRGAYKGLRDYLLELPYATNCVIRGGAGSTLRMWKKDYQGPDYKHGEWRYALRIYHCENVLVEGISLVESGGDGIGVTGRNITIRNCVCDRNHRQGISVFSAENLLIEDCVLSNTSGTPPQAGIDIEPDRNKEVLKNVVLRNVRSFGNVGNGFELYLNNLDDTTPPISVLFDKCVSEGNATSASVHGGSSRVDHFVKGKVEFTNCTFESPRRAGIFVGATPASAYDVRFANCTISNAVKDVRFASATLAQGQPDGIALENLLVYQPTNRPWFGVGGRGLGPTPTRISGSVTVVKPDGRRETVKLDQAWANANIPEANGGRPLPPKATFPEAKDVVAVDAKPGQTVALPPMTFIGGARLVFWMEKPGEAVFTARQISAVKGRPAETVPYVVTKLNAGSKKGKSWKIPAVGFESREFTFKAPSAGFYSLEVKRGGTRFALEKSSVPIAINLANKEQIVAARGGKPFSLYFDNPGAKPFVMMGAGDDYYVFGMSVADPSGKVLAQQDVIDGLFFANGEAQAAKGLWRVDLRRARRPNYDWITLDLYGAPAFLFLSPEKTWRLR
ncbi:MAG: right-handed parallel beta-helix repeat-containing protein [Kiritimatiellae bacterium]|nr:right-handed parallel beta-helix repeat-containing protein [Kiritimatiellia bacterium]